MRNPVDMIASATPDSYALAIDTVMRDDNVHAAIAAFVPPLGVAVFGWPLLSLLALISVIAAIPPFRRVWGRDSGAALNPALGETARLLLIYSVLLALGVGLG